MFRCLRRPFPLVVALLFPLVMSRRPPCSYSIPLMVLRLRKVHADYVNIRTGAYLNPVKVMTVKKLLGSRVTLFEFTGAFRLLSGDDRITTAGLLFESGAVEKADAASH